MPSNDKSTVSLIVIAYNSLDYLLNLLPTIESSRLQNVIIVDNNSTDDTCNRITSRYPQVRIIKNTINAGYAAAINMGVKKYVSDYYIVSNADVEYISGSIDVMADYLRHNDNVGIVGPQQIYPDHQWQRSYGMLPCIGEGLSNLFGVTSLNNAVRKLLWPRLKVDNRTKEVGYIDGAVMAFRRDAFNSVGGFDEGFFFYAEEADFCLRLKKAGWKIVFLPSALVTHVRGGNSTNTDEINPKYSEMLVNSKLSLVTKHFSPSRARAYCYIQMLHALKMNLAYGLITAILGREFSPTISRKRKIFKLLTNIWKDKIRASDAAH